MTKKKSGTKKNAKVKIDPKLKKPPFETDDLRTHLANYLDTEFTDETGQTMKVGNYRWGCYAFYDYDDEPIYVGQTNERLRTRIRRHLTNQRTDAVAMNVLDPFEVKSIEVWPIPDLETAKPNDKDAQRTLNDLERQITGRLTDESKFKAILNEKDPPPGNKKVTEPKSFRKTILSDRVMEIRQHPDLRNARRAQTIARLAQTISEREVKQGLRRVLVVQAQRLEWLARRRFDELGGQATVEMKDPDKSEEENED
jgi:hypothetical protein